MKIVDVFDLCYLANPMLTFEVINLHNIINQSIVMVLWSCSKFVQKKKEKWRDRRSMRHWGQQSPSDENEWEVLMLGFTKAA